MKSLISFGEVPFGTKYRLLEHVFVTGINPPISNTNWDIILYLRVMIKGELSDDIYEDVRILNQQLILGMGCKK
jgi:hypothetical protein